MTFQKTGLLPLAICLLLSTLSLVSGRPNTKHYLVQTKDNPKKYDKMIRNMNNYNPRNIKADGKGYPAGSDKTKTIDDYVANINNSGFVGHIIDGSTNFDYAQTVDDYDVCDVCMCCGGGIG